jgi:hypothetical protein
VIDAPLTESLGKRRPGRGSAARGGGLKVHRIDPA